MQNYLKLAKNILMEDEKVLYGIFGKIASYDYFPPRSFLNEFLMVGYDPCDQDGRMESWKPFSLSAEDYLLLKEWWISNHLNTLEDSLGVTCWSDWIQEILNI
jgi:hypothetical protein